MCWSSISSQRAQRQAIDYLVYATSSSPSALELDGLACVCNLVLVVDSDYALAARLCGELSSKRNDAPGWRVGSCVECEL